MNKKNTKRQNIVQLILVLVIIAAANVLSSFVSKRVDLTSDKRFTLSSASKDFLKNLHDIVYIKVYLDGEMPAGFKRLHDATRDLLDEMRVYAGDNLQYEFIDPSANPDEKERSKLYNQLADRGLQPTNIKEKNKEGSVQRILFPGAMVNYLAQEQAVQLLKDRIGASPEEMLNNSIEGVEYELINTIKKVTTIHRKLIGFLYGHGEMEKNNLADIMHELGNSYDVKRVSISENVFALKNFDCLIVPKPDSAFSEKDKFIIDQFIMKGGKVIWLLDLTTTTMDSLARKNETIGMSRTLNLDDMLFHYGARVNYDLVEDLYSVPIPMLTGYSGTRPQTTLLPWYFFPLITPSSTHPIVNNLNAIKFEFAGSVDTVGAKGITKTVLLASSRFSKAQPVPVRISIDMMRKEPDPKEFDNPFKPMAVLLEGTFQSLYTNRIPSTIAGDSAIAFKAHSEINKMIVVGDGDVIRNEYKKSNGMIYPLGYDRYTNTFYGNKNFILNSVDYLCDTTGLMTLRSKELKLRLLDKASLDESGTSWKIINTIGPVLLILIFGIVKNLVRKKRFSS